MKLFGDSPQERAMQSLVHDTNEAICQMTLQVQEIEKWLQENKEQIKNCEKHYDVYIRAERLKSSCEKFKKAIDIYYDRFSKDFIEEEILVPRTPSLSTEEALKKEVQWLRNRYNTIRPTMSRLTNYYRAKYIELEKLYKSKNNT